MESITSAQLRGRGIARKVGPSDTQTVEKVNSPFVRGASGFKAVGAPETCNIVVSVLTIQHQSILCEILRVQYTQLLTQDDTGWSSAGTGRALNVLTT